jgi:hypothetical protein
MKALTYLICLWSCIDTAALIISMFKREWGIFLWAGFVQGILTALAFRVFK